MSPQDFVREFRWSMETLRIAHASNFRCVYCGHYFFDSVDAWTQFNVDHLRPGSAGDRDEREENKVAACWTCNKLKSNFDPGTEIEGEGARDQLIEIARRYIHKARFRRNEKVQAMREASAKLQW